MDIVKTFEEDVVARKRLAKLLVGESDVRLAIISAVLRDVATKSNIEKLRGEFKSNIERLKEEFRDEINKLRNEFKSDIERPEQRVDGLEERVSRLEESYWT